MSYDFLKSLFIFPNFLASKRKAVAFLGKRLYNVVWIMMGIEYFVYFAVLRTFHNANEDP